MNVKDQITKEANKRLEEVTVWIDEQTGFVFACYQDELVDWIEDPENHKLLVALVLNALSFCKCYLVNRVDQAVEEKGLEFEDHRIKKPEELE